MFLSSLLIEFLIICILEKKAETFFLCIEMAISVSAAAAFGNVMNYFYGNTKTPIGNPITLGGR